MHPKLCSIYINIQNHILAAQSVAESLSIIFWLMTFTPTTQPLWPFYIFLEVFLHTKKIYMKHENLNVT